MPTSFFQVRIQLIFRPVIKLRYGYKVSTDLANSENTITSLLKYSVRKHDFELCVAKQKVKLYSCQLVQQYRLAQLLYKRT